MTDNGFDEAVEQELMAREGLLKPPGIVAVQERPGWPFVVEKDTLLYSPYIHNFWLLKMAHKTYFLKDMPDPTIWPIARMIHRDEALKLIAKSSAQGLAKHWLKRWWQRHEALIVAVFALVMLMVVLYLSTQGLP